MWWMLTSPEPIVGGGLSGLIQARAHVDGHRGPAFVISPYSASGVDNGYYTQLDMVRTIEQILGIHPMNQEDLAAEPMYDAFTEHPNYTPYSLQQNQIPLTLGAPGYPSTYTPSAGVTPAERPASRAQGVVPADMESVYNAWEAWNAQQGREGHFDGPDKVNPQQLNRYDWYSAHDWGVTYPGDPKIYLPDQGRAGTCRPPSSATTDPTSRVVVGA
jgi:hypothetical protein